MKKTKDTIKQLGEKLQNSNETHRTMLRSQLMDTMEGKNVRTSRSIWKPIIISFSSVMAVIILAVSLRPSPNVVYYDDFTLGSGGGAFDMAMPASEPPSATSRLSEIADELFYPAPNQRENDGEVIDYRKENGEMLEQNFTFHLLSRKDDADGQVRKLFTSVGGHVSNISSYSDDQATITGVIPVESIDLFIDELHSFVKNDAFIIEYLNAHDLIPQAIVIDDNIEDLQSRIEGLKEDLVTENDHKEYERIEQEIQNLEDQVDRYEDQKIELGDRADFVDVTVSVEELPGLWKATDYDDLQRIITGYDDPGFGQRIWINLLFIIAWLLTVFSVTFWLVIPLGIWLTKRRRTQKTLKELN